ncbi:MAG: UDP-N-acetylglucosamine--N-acetylmuramyl-(pentapeptide) pyrophosphoryl-undecaprenol N-acetylglucosamine transferase, partial [Nitrospira sp.]|nr:UDP-N-acetylglucosamine--N-acetylmuramyl-(pentapeptide) pyrophosphoryl-undecaprenol N-acetylglucosamine transferase [Nitrospira sp.]
LISAQPVMGKGLWGAMRGLCAMPVSLWQCVNIVRTKQADLVIGVGGYTSPMMILAAALSGVARVILEPNAYPGMANKAVGPFAQRVFLAFESAADSFARSKVRVVGTPIRQAFLDGAQRSQPKPGSFHLLVFGGSQGAKAINSAVLEGLPGLMTQLPQLTITHQTGASDHVRVAEAYRRAGIAADVTPFLYDMPEALRQADLVVARAGAMTVAELTTCGKPAILIPLPSAIYDHQTHNAKVMEAAGAALVLPQAGLTGPALADAVAGILRDSTRVCAMGAASLAMRRTDAAEVIVRECYALMEGHHDSNRSVGKAGV